MIEEIRPVPGYEELYYISDLGKLYSVVSGKMVELRSTHKSDWYVTVRLCKNGIQTPTRIHRLVANEFIPNPHKKRCVNHKNGDKTDNRAHNLEWVTHSENTYHAVKNKLMSHAKGASHPKSKLVIDLRTGIFYDSVGEAALSRNINRETAKKYVRNGKYDLQFC